MTDDNEPRLNTDRELFREPIPPTGMSPARVFVTREGAIGMEVGGYVVVRPIRSWHQLTHPGDVAAYERVLAFLQQEREEAEGHTEDMACLDRVIERVVIMLEVAGNANRKLKGD